VSKIETETMIAHMNEPPMGGYIYRHSYTHVFNTSIHLSINTYAIYIYMFIGVIKIETMIARINEPPMGGDVNVYTKIFGNGNMYKYLYVIVYIYIRYEHKYIHQLWLRLWSL
jgi:hypothetical protein